MSRYSRDAERAAGAAGGCEPRLAGLYESGLDEAADMRKAIIKAGCAGWLENFLDALNAMLFENLDDAAL